MASTKATEEVKLMGIEASPFVIRARIALNIKGVPYEFVEEDMKNNGDLSSPLKSNPLFLHAGQKISEPYKIVEYIDATWSVVDTPPILPVNDYDRIVQTFWAAFIDDKFALALKEILKGSTEVEEIHKTMQTLECAFDRYSQGKNFFGGDSVNYIDISLGSMLGFLKAAHLKKLKNLKLMDEEKTPLLVSWAECFSADASVKGMIPEPEKLVELVNQINGSAQEMEENEAYAHAMQMIQCSILPMTLKVVLELGVLDVVVNAGSGKFLSTKEIADELCIGNPDAPVLLDRLLRCLASHGIFTYKLETSDDGTTVSRLYGAAPLCFYLVNDEDGVSMAPLFFMIQDKVMMEIWNNMKDAVINGGIPFDKTYGMKMFEYNGKDLRFNKVFNDCMVNHSTLTLKKILNSSYTGFDGLKTLVDVGGNVGVTLKSVISKHPTIKGINFDLPHVIAKAAVIEGVNHVVGDMFENIPSGDAILLKWILHDWSDEHCVKLLKNCWKTLPKKGKVIVIEGIVPIAPEASSPAFEGDILMFINLGGKERTEMEYTFLAKKAGFSGLKIACTIGHISIMEFIK